MSLEIQNTKRIFHAVNMLVVLLVPFIYGMRFYNTDDVLMRNMLTGSMQFMQSPFVLFFPPWYGKLYVWLYTMVPQIEWYFVIDYLAIVTVYLVLGNIMYSGNLKKNWIWFASFLAYFFIYGKLLSTEVHFTLLAGMLSLTGAVLFIRSGRVKKSSLIVSMLLLLWGLAFRYQSALLTAACFFIFLWLYQTIVSGGAIFPDTGTLKRGTLFLFLPFLIIWISFKAEPKEIKELRKTSVSFLKVFDYKILENETTKAQAFQKVGWDSTEMNLLNWYIIPDSKPFSAGKMTALASLNKGGIKPFQSAWIKQALDYLWRLEFGFPFIACMVFVGFVMSDNRFRFLWFAAAATCTILVLIILLKWTFKFPSQYIMLPIFSGFLFLVFFQIAENLGKIMHWRTTLLLLPLLSAGYIMRKNQSETVAFIKGYLPAKTTPISLPENKYLVVLSMLNHDCAFPAYYSGSFYKRLSLENIFYLSPLTYHPASRLLDGNGEKDVLKWLVNNPEASLYWGNNYESQIPYAMPAIQAYLKKTYSLDAGITAIKAKRSNMGIETFLVQKED